MYTRFAKPAAQLFVLLACTLPVQAIACKLHQDPSLQNSFGEFHLPSPGARAADVARIYGEPLRRLGSGTGLSMWDYGSFKVMLKDNRVTAADMW